MLLLPLPLLLLLVRLNLLVLFPGALPLASAGVGGYIYIYIYIYNMFILFSVFFHIKMAIKWFISKKNIWQTRQTQWKLQDGSGDATHQRSGSLRMSSGMVETWAADRSCKICKVASHPPLGGHSFKAWDEMSKSFSHFSPCQEGHFCIWPRCCATLVGWFPCFQDSDLAAWQLGRSLSSRKLGLCLLKPRCRNGATAPNVARESWVKLHRCLELFGKIVALEIFL